MNFWDRLKTGLISTVAPWYGVYQLYKQPVVQKRVIPAAKRFIKQKQVKQRQLVEPLRQSARQFWQPRPDVVRARDLIREFGGMAQEAPRKVYDLTKEYIGVPQFGEYIGETMALPSVLRTQKKIEQSRTERFNKLFQAAKQTTDPDEKIRLLNLARDIGKENQLINQLDITSATPKMVIGSAVETAADVLGAGEFGNLARKIAGRQAIKQFGRSALPRIGRGIVEGGVAMTGYGARKGMSRDEIIKQGLIGAGLGGAGAGILGSRAFSRLMGADVGRLGRRVEDIASIGQPRQLRQAGFARLPEERPRLLPSERKFGLTPEGRRVFREGIEGAKIQTRGRIPWEETERRAAESVKKTVEDYSKLKRGQTLNAEQLKRLNRMLVDRTNKVGELQDLIYRQGQNSEDNLVRLHKAIAEQASLQRVQRGVSAETGRALNILKTTSKALDSGNSQTIKKVLESLGGREFTEDIAKKLAQFDPTDREGIYQFMRDLYKPKFGDYVEELWYNSILSGPFTHLRNFIGNTTNLAFESIAQPLSTIGKKGATVENVKTIVGGIRGLQDGVNKALYILKKGYRPEQAAMLELRRPQAFRGTLGAIINLPTRGLMAMDALFRSIAKSRELYGTAAETAMKKGYKGEALNSKIAELIKNPTAEMLERAEKYGSRAVFQSDPDKFTQAIAQATNVKVAGIKPLKFVAAFVQTPSNILKQGLEAGPTGFLRTGRETIRETAMAKTRAALGSAILASLATFAMSGRISGSGRSLSEAERDKLYRRGWQPNSIKIGDKWYSYQNINPINIPLSMVGNAYELYKEKGEVPSLSELAPVVLKMGNSLLDQSYLQGISNLFNALESPEYKGKYYLQNTIASFASPGFIRQTVRAIKPTIYEREGLGQMLKAGYGLTAGLFPRRNVWGEAIKGVPATGLPIFPTTEKVSALERELDRLNITPTFVSDRLSISGETQKLPQELANKYQELAGKTSKKALEDLIASKYYKKLSYEKQQKAVEDTIDEARDKAREVIRSIARGGKEKEIDIRSVQSQEEKDLKYARYQLDYQRADERDNERAMISATNNYVKYLSGQIKATKDLDDQIDLQTDKAIALHKIVYETKDPQLFKRYYNAARKEIELLQNKMNDPTISQEEKLQIRKKIVEIKGYIRRRAEEVIKSLASGGRRGRGRRGGRRKAAKRLKAIREAAPSVRYKKVSPRYKLSRAQLISKLTARTPRIRRPRSMKIRRLNV